MKKIHLDILRIIAIYFIIFNHTYTNGYFLFSIRRDSLFFPFYLFLSIACKIAVPIFFMISGALLLKKEDSLQLILKKRVLRIVIVLTVFSFFQYLYSLNFQFEEFSWSEFFTILYSSEHATAYWYLYAYLGYLLMIPFLRKLATYMSNKEFIWLILLRLIIGALLPIMQYLIWKGDIRSNPDFLLNIVVQDSIFYPLLGYYIEHLVPRKYINKKIMIQLLFASICAISISGLLTYYRCVQSNDWSVAPNQIFHSILIFIPAAAIFYSIKLTFMTQKLSIHIFQIIRLATKRCHLRSYVNREYSSRPASYASLFSIGFHTGGYFSLHNMGIRSMYHWIWNCSYFEKTALTKRLFMIY